MSMEGKKQRRADRRKYHYIYKTVCKITNKYYIGMHSTDNLEDGYIGSGKILWRSINKYGKDAHTKEILEFCNSRRDLRNREAEIVNLNEIAKDGCMNIQPGGGGGLSSPEHAEKFHKAGVKATNIKMWVENRETHSLRLSLQSKKRLEDPEYRKKIFKNLNWEGRSHSEETKSKLRKSKNVGESNPSFGTCWITKSGINKKIKKEDLNLFVENGWHKGRKIK